MIIILDYGTGNVLSIENMLKKVGHRDVKVSKNLDDIMQADKLILPGVGHFDYGITKLRESGLIEVIEKKVLAEKIPILGICLGLQLMTKGSEEGKSSGLGWLDANTVKFRKEEMANLKIPHMGWTDIDVCKEDSLLQGLPDDSRFYFVHSYHLVSSNEEQILIKARYGYSFVAGMSKDNIRGVQFHPEKSHKFGMTLLKNFAELE